MIGSSKQMSDPSERKVPWLRNLSGTRLPKSSGSSAANICVRRYAPECDVTAAAGTVILR